MNSMATPGGYPVTADEEAAFAGVNSNGSDPSNVKSPLKDLHKAVRPALDKAGESIRVVQQKAGQSLRDVQLKTGESIRQVQQKVGQVLEKAGPPIRELSQQVGQQVGQVMEKAGPSVRQVGQHVGSALGKADTSVRQIGAQVGQVTAQKSRELADVTVRKSREISMGTQIAVAAATASTAHTISQIGSHPLEPDEEMGGHKVKGETTDSLVTGVHEFGIQTLSIACFVSAFVSMVLTSGHLIDFGSLLTMILSPLVFWQKVQLKGLGGMRGQQNALREKVNTLTVENTKLTSSIDTMEKQVESLKHVEKELDGIAAKAGGQVDRLVNIVHENGLIQAKIKERLNEDIMQQIITAVLTTDRDGDYTLNRMERKQLEIRLTNSPGFIFHRDRFDKYCTSDAGDLTLADITMLARNLEDPNIPPEKRIFEYAPKQIMEVHKASQQQLPEF